MRLQLFTSGLALLSCVACSNSQPFTTNKVAGQDYWGETGVPTCEINLAQYDLHAHINSFEFSGSFSGSVGSGGGDINGDGTFEFRKIKFKMDMTASAPLDTAPLSKVPADADQNQFSVDGSVDFGEIVTNPKYYYETPLAEVSMKAITNGLDQLAEDKNVQQAPWIGRLVRRMSDVDYLINAGTNAGLVVGDEFDIYNVENFWSSGVPCNGRLELSRHTSTAPIAHAIIRTVSGGKSHVEITRASGEPPKLGAEVVLVNAIAVSSEKEKPAPRIIKRLVSIGNVTQSASVSLPDGSHFDFTIPVRDQLSTNLTHPQFVVLEK